MIEACPRFLRPVVHALSRAKRHFAPVHAGRRLFRHAARHLHHGALHPAILVQTGCRVSATLLATGLLGAPVPANPVLHEVAGPPAAARMTTPMVDPVPLDPPAQEDSGARPIWTSGDFAPGDLAGQSVHLPVPLVDPSAPAEVAAASIATALASSMPPLNPAVILPASRNPAAAPEPGSLGVFATAVTVLRVLRKRRRRGGACQLPAPRSS